MQEREHGDGHQHRAENQVKVHLLQRAFDEAGLIPDDRHLEVRRHLQFQLLEPRLHPVDHLHRVAAGLLAHDERHRVVAVQSRERTRFLHGILHLRHLSQVNVLTAEAADDEILKLSHRPHPAERAHDEFAGALVHPAARNLHVLRLQRRAHLLNRQATRAQLVDVHRHLHRAGAVAGHVDRADVEHGFEALLDDLVREVGHLAQIAGRADAHGDHRRGVHVELVDDGGLGAGGQAREDGVHFVAHVLRCHVAVALKEELDGDAGDPLARDTGQLVNALHRVDDLLQRLGDAGLHLLRGRSAQGGCDRDDGQLDIGKLIDADAEKGNQPEHDEQQVHHRREHRPPDAQVGEANASGHQVRRRAGRG